MVFFNGYETVRTSYRVITVYVRVYVPSIVIDSVLIGLRGVVSEYFVRFVHLKDL